MSDHRAVIVATSIAAFLVPLAVVSQDIRVGAELQVSSYTAGAQVFPAVAVRGQGDFVVAWRNYSGPATGYDVFARRFSSAGYPLGNNFPVNTYLTGTQGDASVAVSSSGAFVVAWTSNDQDRSGRGVFARRFSSSGSPLGTEFQVSIRTVVDQAFPSIALSSTGSFVVAWEADVQDGSYEGIYMRRFASDGTPVGGESIVNVVTSLNQRDPSVAASPSGAFVVTWASYAQDGHDYGVFARRFSSAGAAIGTEFQVNNSITGAQRFPAAAMDADGDFAVTWSGQEADGSGYAVLARRFASNGSPLGGEFQVNSVVTGDQNYSAIAMSSTGNMTISWRSALQDGAGDGVFARRLSSTGAALASEFQVSTYTLGNQSFPQVATDGAQRFVIAWNSNGQDGSGYGAFAQRFAVPITLDVDGNGLIEPLTDGLLTLRYMFGFRGVPLVIGAVDDNCTRCNAPSIEAYLAGLTT
jgi:hypothetical protein